MLAELDGWKRDGQEFCKGNVKAFYPPIFCEANLPNYPADLNACHAVERKLESSVKVEFNGSLYYSQQTFYICNLADVLRGSPAGTFSWSGFGLNAGQVFEIANAKPRIRTIALILTLQA